jgi:hypothetical protein
MLLREAAATVQTRSENRTEDRTWIGGTPGILAVLHRWRRTMEYHPHAQLLVTAGGLGRDGSPWVLHVEVSDTLNAEDNRRAVARVPRPEMVDTLLQRFFRAH